MIQLLIISENQCLPDSIRVLVDESRCQCHGKTDVGSSLHLLETCLFNACLLETDLTTVKPIQDIEQLRGVNPHIPLILLAGSATKEWEEEACLKGADFVLHKPLRGTLLNNLLNKFVAIGAGRADDGPGNGVPLKDPFLHPGRPTPPLPALEILRDFSRILSFSLNLKSFTYQFALKLREIISVNRIAIFIETQRGIPFNPLETKEPRHLKCLCSVGIEPELFNYLTLSTRNGIGQAVLKSGRILRANPGSSETLLPPDSAIQREFHILGGQIAIPILDRERAIGVAVLGDRLTGQPFTDEEIQLLFHLMEELGMAIKSNLLHDQLVSHHRLISNVFSQMDSGCLVVDHDLDVLHANPALHEFLQLSPPVQFSSLPRKLSSLLYEAAHLGKLHEPFPFREESRPDRHLRVSIIPFREENAKGGAMMFVEDFTMVEAAREAEVQASNLRLIAIIAEKFAHEIRNALVPLKTYGQLIPERHDNPEFRQMLEDTIFQETRRIGRLTDQLLYLSKQDLPLNDSESPSKLLQAAFEQAKALFPGEAELACGKQFSDCLVPCDSASLRHAFFEILLNGFQADPDKPKVTVFGTITHDGGGRSFLKMDFRDQGKGLPKEISEKATEPFFTTRNVGVGLGLSVTRKILEAHHGKLDFIGDPSNGPSTVSVTLPVVAVTDPSS